MKLIPLTQGRFAKVDDDDYEMCMSLKWRYTNRYAKAAIYENGKHIHDIEMHRLINETPAGYDTDHINQDKLDNRKNNLRSVTRSINNFNSPPPKDNKSGYKGVIWQKTFQKWWAYININGKQISLGLHVLKDDAIKARKKAEQEYGVCV